MLAELLHHGQGVADAATTQPIDSKNVDLSVLPGLHSGAKRRQLLTIELVSARFLLEPPPDLVAPGRCSAGNGLFLGRQVLLTG